MRTVYGDHDRFEMTYFASFKGFYATGDGARRDEHGYYWITGRIDDVINVSGHRIGLHFLIFFLYIYECNCCC
jgi:acetyl-CoA synthetase